MNKKIALTLVLGILIISPISALSLQTYFNDIFDGFQLGSLVSYTPVYKQNWGNICCVQKFDYDYQIRYIDDITLSKCDQYTNECNYELNNQRGGGFGAVTFCYSICDLNGNNCHSRTCDGWNAWSSAGSDPIYVKLRYGESIKFESGAWWNYVTFTKTWRNFYIKGQENGKIFTQDSCILNSALKQRVLSDGKNELDFDECQNYMLDFIQTATKTYTYLNQEVICQARELYNIREEVFKDGQTRKIQGDRIKSVECCPQEANCDDDTFRFVEENERECEIDSECPNGGNPVVETGTTYIKYSCSSGECRKSSSITVECTNNQICISKYGANSICDLSTSNYGNCKNNNQPIGYCGDNICEDTIGETVDSCPSDCGEINRDESNDWWVWIIIILVGLILLRFLRPILKQIPIIGGFFK